MTQPYQNPEVRLGSKVRKYRIRSGMLQAELGSKLDLGKSVVCQIESGKRALRATELPILSKILQVPICDFFQDSEDLRDQESWILSAQETEQLRDFRDFLIQSRKSRKS